jgi:peptidoglycan/LPS O-acetylase OafA/YrhL
MQYRPAIDGLRAAAVILVLLFHAKMPFVSGGFVGVDVFFVISGYLITSLIQHEQASGRFTLAGFYERRMRRILPAFFLVTLAIVVVAVFVMLPKELGRLTPSVVAATLFVSNFYFWWQGGNYLRDPPESEPLLHTWSLAIEEQFYLMFPIAMLWAMRLFKRLDLIFIVVGIASLAGSVYLTSTHPRGAFYFSPGRAWELLLGAWLAVSRSKDRVPEWIRPALQWAGLGAITAAACLYTTQTPFPGLAALVPCVGTLLLIAWCDRESRLIGWLSHPLVVWVGLISYPLYLWHWPALVLARATLIREPDPYEITALYLLSVVLAAATWRYLETPIRARKGRGSAKAVFAGAATAGGVVILLSASLNVGARFWTMPPDAARILEAAEDYAPRSSPCHNWDRVGMDKLSDCTIGAAGRPGFDFVLWGDSHAGAIGAATDTAGHQTEKRGLQLTADSCPPLLGMRIFDQGGETHCEAYNDAALRLVRQLGIRQAILAGAWIQYVAAPGTVIRLRQDPGSASDNLAVLQRSLQQTIERLRAIDTNVLLVGPVPEIGWHVPTALAKMAWHGQPLREGPAFADFLQSEQPILAELKKWERNGVPVVYPHERLCKSTCAVRLGDTILYSDSEHLTKKGAELLLPQLARYLSER